MAELKKGDIHAFQIKLLSKTLDSNRYPLTKLIIEKTISKQEYEELIQLLNQLNEKYEQQKEAGLLNFTSLLIHFAGMLNAKLHPDELIQVLKKEGCYTSLMNEFTHILSGKQSEIRKR